MHLIAVDIGNSTTKIAVENQPDDDRWLETVQFQSGEIDSAKLLKAVPESPNALWAVCSVNQQQTLRLNEWVSQHRPKDRFHILSENDIPLKSNVESRAKLGRDRLVAAWSAFTLNEVGPIIVIDTGTAVTIDLIDENGLHAGGFIYPGVMANLRILNQATDALPDLTEAQLNNQIDFQTIRAGTNTIEAILMGANQSQISALTGIVSRLSEELSKTPAVYMTGGTIPIHKPALPDNWIHVPDLVLRGARDIGKRLLQSPSNSIDSPH